MDKIYTWMNKAIAVCLTISLILAICGNIALHTSGGSLTVTLGHPQELQDQRLTQLAALQVSKRAGAR